MFKKILFSTFIIFLLAAGFDSKIKVVSADKPTDIYLIGTVHIGTNNFNSDTLLNILNVINPDVILIECDTSYMTDNFELKEEIKYAFLETTAITEYLKKKEVQIRPFDLEGGDVFFENPVRKINESNFFNDIQSLAETQNAKLNGEAVSMLEKFSSMINIADEMSNTTISYINSQEGSVKIDTINYYSYEGLDQLIVTLPELLQYKSYWLAEHDNWNKRNEAMLTNILKYAGFFEGKKIIVLCGFAHKNFLRKELQKHKHINVKEYWE